MRILWRLSNFVLLIVLELFIISLNADLPEWENASGYRKLKVTPVGSGTDGFTRIDGTVSKVHFENHVSADSIALNRILENGSGVALGDVNGDGWCDLYFCSMQGSNQLYLNKGNWEFELDAEAENLAFEGQHSTGATLVDIDGDQDLDLLINFIGQGTRLMINDGMGRFQAKVDSGLLTRRAAHSMALADVDGDDDLDLYVANYRTTSWQDLPRGEKRRVSRKNGKTTVTPSSRFQVFESEQYGGVAVMELGEPDCFYINDGSGRFTRIPWTDGRFLRSDGGLLEAPPRDWGLSVMFHDLNQDGAPDIYVCNDFYHSYDRVWINNGNGNFHPAKQFAFRSFAESSMAVDAADINRDGFDDLLVIDMLSLKRRVQQTRWENVFKSMVPVPEESPDFTPEFPRNMLYLNRGDHTYAEISRLAGLDATEWSWGTVFLDVDLDGYEDVLIGNGHNRDMLHSETLKNLKEPRSGMSDSERIKRSAQFMNMLQSNLAFRNNGNLEFEDRSVQWGFNEYGISHGMALGDLDNDGDLDVVINNFNQSASLYRNNSSSPRIGVRLKGASTNTGGIGARITLKGESLVQSKEVHAGGRYLSSDDAMVMFAAHDSIRPHTLEVVWRSGKKSIVNDISPDFIYEIHEPNESENSISKPVIVKAANPWFENRTDRLLGHADQTLSFDDYACQPLLPRKLSYVGPGVSWFDLDQDGWDDLLIGGGTGGHFSMLKNLNNGSFENSNPSPINRDQTTILGWVQEPGIINLLAGFSSYRNPENPQGAIKIFSVMDQQSEEFIHHWNSSIGPMAMADYDGDGDLDLFAGGRVIPGRYPESATSKLFLNTNGKFDLDEKNNSLLDGIGLVNGATFSDINGDGYPDLILACEWSPVRLFANIRGRFREITSNTSLASWTGLWQGVATGDFNGDGRMDIIATNWGRNNRYNRHLKNPLTLYYGDLNGNNTVELIQTYYDKNPDRYVPWKNLDEIATFLPSVRTKYSTREEYSVAGIEEILGDQFQNLEKLQITTLDSMVFLSTPKGFEAKPLPVEAQFSPAFGISISDFNGDGNEDIFLAQNCFAIERGNSRQDAGVGLMIEGDGKGNFRSLGVKESGIRLYGDQRSSAVADYDRDGRPDLVVTQYQGRTRLFHNVSATPGLRVRLRGPRYNRAGIGTQLALVFKNGKRGLLRELKCGSGFWSQDSNVLILPNRGDAEQIWIRWPRGKETTTDLPPNTREVIINGLGELVGQN